MASRVCRIHDVYQRGPDHSKDGYVYGYPCGRTGRGIHPRCRRLRRRYDLQVLLPSAGRRGASLTHISVILDANSGQVSGAASGYERDGADDVFRGGVLVEFQGFRGCEDAGQDRRIGRYSNTP
jgi:hypothetical protein